MKWHELFGVIPIKYSLLDWKSFGKSFTKQKNQALFYWFYISLDHPNRKTMWMNVDNTNSLKFFFYWFENEGVYRFAEKLI